MKRRPALGSGAGGAPEGGRLPSMSLPHEQEDARGLHVRLALLGAVALLLLFALLGRLWYLQVVKGTEFRIKSESNRVRLQRVTAPRGLIFDREGRRLVDNRASFDVAIRAEEIRSDSPVLDRLAELLRLDREVLAEQWRTARRRPFEPYPVARDVAWEDLARIETHRPYLPGVEILVSARRDYLYGPLFAHTIGYVGEISEAELAREGEFGPYRPGSLVGKSGLERVLEADLRGVDGGTQVEVDAYGRILRELGSVPGSPGASVTLTIDLDLQQAMAEAYEGREGAAVALDPRNGEILAMYSAPSFDPAVFLRGLRPEEWAALSGDPHKPLENKAMRGEYPPGSVFKIVTALAGFQTGALDVNRGVHCSGALHFGGRRFGCWKKGGHGGVDFIASLARSCDVYYYTLGLKIGVNAIADTARALGLGRATGVDLPGEREGNIPTREWKKRRFGEPWYDGETLPVAIGQGYVTTTPLQIAVMGAAVANGGTVYAPHLVRETADPSGEDVRRIAPKALSRLRVDEKAMHLVHEALRTVVNEPGGTGSRAKLPGVQVAGKTGTAQVVGLKREEGKPPPKLEDIPYEFRDHAWFLGFAPHEGAEIVVAALVEHGGGGGAEAAPVVQRILARHFGIELPKPPPPPMVAATAVAGAVTPTAPAGAASAPRAAPRKPVPAAEPAAPPPPAPPPIEIRFSPAVDMAIDPPSD